MSFPSKCCTATAAPAGSITAVATGLLLVAGIVALAWLVIARHADREDPLEETDRRLSELEKSLHRLHDNVGQSLIR